MLRFLKFTYAIWFALVFALTFLVLYPVFVLLLWSPKSYKLANHLRRFWARLIMLLSGIFIKIEYETPLPKNQVMVFVSNHTSYLDILAMALTVKGNFMFLAKQELAKIPLFGIFFRTVDLAVNRNSPTAAAASFKKASQRLSLGTHAILFPEGTIGSQVPKLKKFKPGAFKLALDCNKSIVPVTLLSNWKLLPDNKGLQAQPGIMRVFVHRPIDTSSLNNQDVHVLSSQVYAIIENKLREKNIIPKEQ